LFVENPQTRGTKQEEEEDRRDIILFNCLVPFDASRVALVCVLIYEAELRYTIHNTRTNKGHSGGHRWVAGWVVAHPEILENGL
jgi:hypothetical protein